MTDVLWGAAVMALVLVSGVGAVVIGVASTMLIDAMRGEARSRRRQGAVHAD